MNHANYVIIHDATHNLILRSKSWNKMIGILADLPNLTPGAMGFRVYHLKHHSHQGDYEYDADLANHWARLVGNKWYRKALWLMLFPFFQLTRPPRLKAITMWDRWFFVNFACVAVYDAAIVYFCGWAGLLISRFHFSSRSGCIRWARVGSRSITLTSLTRRRRVITDHQPCRPQ